MLKKIMSMLLICAMAISLSACGEVDKFEKKMNIEIEVEEYGVIKAELYPDLAPETVNNFLKLMAEDFFAGLVFHRVVPGFVIQGGGKDANGMPKYTSSIFGEFESNGFENSLGHTRGVLSMARGEGQPDSASSQFFICTDAASNLDGNYASFGIVTEGMDIVDKIVALETYGGEDPTTKDMPLNPPVIKTIRRVAAEQ